MKLLNSLIIDSINNKLNFIQTKLQNFVESSVILKNLDNFIFIFICLTLIFSLFLPSESIAVFALVVVFLSILKLFICKGQKIELISCNLFLLIYLGFNIISAVNSELYLASLQGLLKTFIYIGFYFSVIQYLKLNKEKIFPIIFLIAICVCFEGFVGLIQSTVGLQNISTWQDTSYLNPEQVISRVYGTLLPYNPNLLGGYMIAAFASVIAVIFVCLINRRFISSLVFSALGLITLLTLFYTGCRGAYLAVFFMFLLLILISWFVIFRQNGFSSKVKKIWKSAVISLTAVGTMMLFAIPGFLHRILSIFIMRADSSTSFRMNVYNASFQMFQDNWLLGIGTGNKVFREIYGLYMMSGFDALSCYCVFLEMAIESGIFALLAFLAFLFLLVKSAVTVFVNTKDLAKRVLIAASVISILSVMLHGLVDTVYFRPQIQFVFWTIAAILVVLVQNKEINE